LSEEPRGIFVFDITGDLDVFPSIAEATAYMEPPDVESGEYVALFTLDGRVVTAAVKDGRVVLTVSSKRDEPDFSQRLLRFRQLSPLDLPEDRVALANALLRWEWDHRWPKRPRWFSRRLFGDGPARL